MTLPLIFLIAAGIFFVIEAFRERIGFPVKWWALGVACYLFSLAAA